jgi:hypothetical protein
MAGKKIEDMMIAAGGDWAGVEQLTPTSRIGWANNFLLVEKTLENGDTGIYPLPYVPEDRFEDFLAWLANL